MQSADLTGALGLGGRRLSVQARLGTAFGGGNALNGDGLGSRVNLFDLTDLNGNDVGDATNQLGRLTRHVAAV